MNQNILSESVCNFNDLSIDVPNWSCFNFICLQFLLMLLSRVSVVMLSMYQNVWNYKNNAVCTPMYLRHWIERSFNRRCRAQQKVTSRLKLSEVGYEIPCFGGLRGIPGWNIEYVDSFILLRAPSLLLVTKMLVAHRISYPACQGRYFAENVRIPEDLVPTIVLFSVLLQCMETCFVKTVKTILSMILFISN